MTGDLKPIASVVLISPADDQQIITDSLDVTNIPFHRSMSEMMETMSFSVPGNHWVNPSEVWRIAVEYQSRVLLYGLVGNCSVSIDGGIITTHIEAVDMAHRLSHLLVPVESTQVTRIGMTSRLTFTSLRPDEILIMLLGTSSHWETDTYIRPGDHIYSTSFSDCDYTFEAGTTRLDAIQKIADDFNVIFCLIYSKSGSTYYADAFFGDISDLEAIDL